MFHTDRTPGRFGIALKEAGVAFTAKPVTTFQINVTRRCNQSCGHCHLDAGPGRDEFMPMDIARKCIDIFAADDAVHTLDITGGAPELHPGFREIAGQAGQTAHRLGKTVIIRHNLTVDPGYDTAGLFARLGVHLVCSLPHHGEYFTDRQRGQGVYAKSIERLKKLNSAGYGTGGDLKLDLVHNPGGWFIPGDQSALEKEYKIALAKAGVTFDRLFTMTNMPIGRFSAALNKENRAGEYMHRLESAFNPQAAGNAMCRSQVLAGHDGLLYDCDFNYALGLPVTTAGGKPAGVADYDSRELAQRNIMVGNHCFACTAGCGSSCTGQVA